MFNPNQTILAGIPTATLQAQLAAAQAAYSKIMIGGMAEMVTHEGKSVRYTTANRGDLVSYIQLLQRQLGLTSGRRAVRPYF